MSHPILPLAPLPADSPSAAAPLRVALIEADFPVPSPVREALASLDDVVVVDTSSHPAPQALVVDLGRDSRGGCALVRAMSAAFPGAPILAVLGVEEPRSVSCALASGARACLTGPSATELLRACLDSIRASVGAATIGRPQLLPELSRRELDVLDGMARGWTYRQIADKLTISPHTVHTHVRKLYEKLDARCREDAVEAARRLGLLEQRP